MHDDMPWKKGDKEYKSLKRKVEAIIQEKETDICAKCGKEIKQGDFQISFGNIDDFDTVEDNIIAIAQKADVINLCKECSIPLKNQLKCIKT